MTLGMAMGTRRRSLLADVGLPVTDGLVLDLDATKLNLSDNDPVVTWPDESGEGNNATQGTASEQPTYKTGVLNGLPVVRFDGTDDFMVAPNGVISGMSAAASVFIVARTLTVQESSIFRSIPDDPANRFNAHLPWTDDSIHFDFGDLNGTGRISVDWGGNTSDFFAWGLMVDTNLMEIRRDGLSLESQAESDTFAPGSMELEIGGYESDDVWHGELAQIVVYDRALTTQEREDVEAHLMSKWGL